TQVAGSKTFGYSDGQANSSFVFGPVGLGFDSTGNLLIVEQGNSRLRVVAGGNIRTIAGKLHFAGDGAAATSALLYLPVELSLDSKGDIFIADDANFRIRELTPDGLISTYVGSGVPGYPTQGARGTTAQLPRVSAMTSDAQGNLFLATDINVLKVAPGGAVTTFAGGPFPGDAGDNGLATNALFESIAGLALDTAGNLSVGDAEATRVRKIGASDGRIIAFAGNSKTGYTGDGGLATAATMNLSGAAPLAVDQKGNVYIGDGYNFAVRMVAP